VQGVMEAGSIVVSYQSLSGKKWTINPQLLDKKVSMSYSPRLLQQQFKQFS